MISKTVLVLAEGFSEGVDAERVASALARGLQASGDLDCDRCALDARPDEPAASAVVQLEEHDFDRRLRAARALVIASKRLDDRTLPGSVAFEAATRARQSGVPTYAVSAEEELDPFEARILDMQVVLAASEARSLAAAGRRLATIV